MSVGERFRRRWRTPHFRHAFGITVVAVLLGATLASMIQMRFDLYSSSTTMTLIGGLTAAVGMLIIWLLDKHRYGWAWAVTLTAPPALYLVIMRVLEANPPMPPLG